VQVEIRTISLVKRLKKCPTAYTTHFRVSQIGINRYYNSLSII